MTALGPTVTTKYTTIRTLFLVLIGMCTCMLMAYYTINAKNIIQEFSQIGQSGSETSLRDIGHTTPIGHNGSEISLRGIGQSTPGSLIQEPNSCLDPNATIYGRVEDIFCLKKCQILPHFKNPCFYENLGKGGKTLRCIPYFYILGAEKAGTTDLFNRLILHPQVIPNRGGSRKETYFWSWARFGIFLKIRHKQKRTIDFFLGMFRDTASTLEKNNALKYITGDASPMDLYDFRTWREVPQNKGRDEPLVLTPSIIKHFHNGHIPKFIVSLREPIERVFSHFIHKGDRPERFHQRVVQSLHEIEMCIKQHDMKYCFLDNSLYHRLNVQIQQSCYAVFIPEWFKVFPRSSFFFTSLEDRSVNMKETYTKLFQFLEIDQLPEKQMLEIEKKSISNRGMRKIGKKVLPETISLLRKFYKECNVGLTELLQDNRFNWN